MKTKLIPVLVILALMMTAGCNKSGGSHKAKEGFIEIQIKHTISDLPLEVNKLQYTNAAGNQYLVTEIQWFLSDIKLHSSSGKTILLGENGEEYYIDTDIPASMRLRPSVSIPAGDYTGLSFTFGINEKKNTTLRFVNPPESFMFWPNYLGGGYHYMKLNGKWINQQHLTQPFNFHLGIGQIYDSIAPKSNWVNLNECCKNQHCEGYTPTAKTLPVAGFVQNYFEVHFNNQPFTALADKTIQFELTMKVENWFQNPHTYNHNQYGGSIMQNQEAMRKGIENGQDVFKLELIGISDE